MAIGGENVGETVEGRERFPINVRYPRELRDSLAGVRDLPVVTERGATSGSHVADVRVSDGPPMLNSENAGLRAGCTWISAAATSALSCTRCRAVAERVKLPPGYAIAWSGQFEYLERAQQRLAVVVPLTLATHPAAALPHLPQRRGAAHHGDAALRPGGGVWLLFLLGHDVSIASAVGFIALAGVAAEFGVVMLIYLEQRLGGALAAGGELAADLVEAIAEGAVLRVRPKAMTVAVILAGLAPILWGRHRIGGDAAHRRAHGGRHDLGAARSMLIVPAAWLLIASARHAGSRRRRAERSFLHHQQESSR